MPWHTHTQKHLHRDTLTYTRLYTQKILHTDCFSEHHRSFEPEKPLHRQHSTHTEAFTQKLSTEAFTQRSFYAQELSYTNTFRYRSLYTRRLLHTEALTQRSLTQSSFYTLQNRKFTGFLMLGHHVMRKGYIWRFDVGQSFCAKGLRLTLENPNLHTFYFAWHGCAWCFKKDKVAFLHLILEHLHLASQNGSFSTAIAVWLSCHACIWTFKITILHKSLTVDRHVVPQGLTKSAFCHMFGRPTCRGLPVPKIIHITPHVGRTTRAISPNGCCGHRRFALHHTTCLPIRHEGSPSTNKTCISPHVWASDTPQKVTFRKPPPGCPCRQRAWTLVELLCGNSSVTISVQMTLQEFCRSSIRGGSPASQLLCEWHCASFEGVT